MKPQMNREGGYVWMRTEEVNALLNVLRNGGSKEVERAMGRRQLLTLPPQPQAWALVYFLLHTGARPSEAYALRWREVDLDARTVKLCGGTMRGAVAPIQARSIPISDAVVSLFRFLAPGAPDQPMFEHDIRLTRVLKTAFDVAGLPRYKLAAMRDTYASHMAMMGVPVEQLARLLGYRSLRFVDRYTHLCPLDLVGAMQSLKYE